MVQQPVHRGRGHQLIAKARVPWCLDYYSAYTAGAKTDPYVTNGFDRVSRVGGWDGNSDDCRSARRVSTHPGSIKGGFRVALAPVRDF